MNGKISNLIKKHKFNSLLVKNFLIILILFFAIMIFSIYFIYKNANETLNKETVQSNQINTERVSTVCDTILNQIEMVIADLEINSNVRYFIYDGSLGDNITNLQNGLEEKISSYPIIYKYIHSIYLYSENTNIVYNKSLYALNQFSDNKWHDNYVKNDMKSQVFARKIEQVYPYALTFVKKVSVFDNNGAIVVNLNLKELGSLLGATLDENQKVYIISDDDQIILSNNHDEFLENKSDVPITNALISSQKKDGIVKYNGGNYAVYGEKSKKYNFSYFVLTNLSEYGKSLNQTMHFVIGITIIILIAVILISLFIATTTYKPVQSIIQLLDNPNYWMNKKTKSTEEINYIAGKILTTIHENDDLHKELETRLDLLNKASITALQAQINPHFLSNSLNLINLQIVESVGIKHPSYTMLNIISKLLRYSLEMSETLVTVRKELEYSKLYFYILKERYEDKIDAIWEIDDSILDNKIVKLSFQPIIENAVFHGICPKNTKGTVTVGGRRVNDDLIFYIKDDGVGMKREKVERLNEDLNNFTIFESKHVGIKNVHQRINLMFGEKYGVQIRHISEDNVAVGNDYISEFIDDNKNDSIGKGTVVYITMPIL